MCCRKLGGVHGPLDKRLVVFELHAAVPRGVSGHRAQCTTLFANANRNLIGSRQQNTGRRRVWLVKREGRGEGTAEGEEGEEGEDCGGAGRGERITESKQGGLVHHVYVVQSS